MLHVEPVRPAVACSVCGTWSRRVHSRYHRTSWDLPWGRWPIQLMAHACRFFCDAPPMSAADLCGTIPPSIGTLCPPNRAAAPGPLGISLCQRGRDGGTARALARLCDQPRHAHPPPTRRAVWEAIQQCRNLGQPLRQIAQALGLDRLTVRRYLAADQPSVYPARRPPVGRKDMTV